MLLMQKLSDIQHCLLLACVSPFCLILKSLVPKLPPPWVSLFSMGKVHCSLLCATSTFNTMTAKSQHGTATCTLLINCPPPSVSSSCPLCNPETKHLVRKNSHLLSKTFVLLQFLACVGCGGCLCVIHR